MNFLDAGALDGMGEHFWIKKFVEITKKGEIPDKEIIINVGRLLGTILDDIEGIDKIKAGSRLKQKIGEKLAKNPVFISTLPTEKEREKHNQEIEICIEYLKEEKDLGKDAALGNIEEKYDITEKTLQRYLEKGQKNKKYHNKNFALLIIKEREFYKKCEQVIKLTENIIAQQKNHPKSKFNELNIFDEKLYLKPFRSDKTPAILNLNDIVSILNYWFNNCLSGNTNDGDYLSLNYDINEFNINVSEALIQSILDLYGINDNSYR